MHVSASFVGMANDLWALWLSRRSLTTTCSASCLDKMGYFVQRVVISMHTLLMTNEWFSSNCKAMAGCRCCINRVTLIILSQGGFSFLISLDSAPQASLRAPQEVDVNEFIAATYFCRFWCKGNGPVFVPGDFVGRPLSTTFLVCLFIWFESGENGDSPRGDFSPNEAALMTAFTHKSWLEGTRPPCTFSLFIPKTGSVLLACLQRKRPENYTKKLCTSRARIPIEVKSPPGPLNSVATGKAHETEETPTGHKQCDNKPNTRFYFVVVVVCCCWNMQKHMNTAPRIHHCFQSFPVPGRNVHDYDITTYCIWWN